MARRNKNTDDLPKVKLNSDSLRNSSKLFEYTGKHKWKLFVGLLFLALTSVTALTFPMLLGNLVKSVEEKNFSTINDTGVLLILILIGQSVFSYFRIYLFVNYTETVPYTHLTLPTTEYV